MDIKIKKRLLSGLTALMVLVGAPTVLPNVINQQALAEDEHVHSPQEGTYSPSGLSQHTYTCENSDSNCPGDGTVTEDCTFSGTVRYETDDDGNHKKFTKCLYCSNEQEETESHKISTTYTKTTNQHTQKDTCTDNCGYEKTHEATDHSWSDGVCNVCEYECQHTSYGEPTYQQNSDDKTHNVTETCTTCGKEKVTQNVTCTKSGDGNTCVCGREIAEENPCAKGHSYTTKYNQSDEKQHWKICDNCNEEDTGNKENHSYVTESTSKEEGEVSCNACKKTHTHSWDSGSSAGEGQTKYNCTTCGATATVTTTTTPTTHTHSYGSEYQNDGKGHHWKKCVGEGTCDITDNSKHAGYGDCSDGDDEDTLCDTCGFDMSNLSTDPGDDEDEDTSSDDYDEEDDDDTSSVPSTPSTPSTPSEPSTPPTPPTVEEVIENMAEDLVADTDISADAPETAIATGAEDLITMLFTENEIKSLDGVNVSVTLSVSANEDDISAADISAVDDAVVDTDYDVAGYFDISLYKSIADLSKSRVTKTNGSLTLVIDIPEELVDADREFAMIRVHDGETDVLDDLDDNPDTITFETDRFSTYALVYKTQDSSAVVDPGDDSPVDDPTGGDNTGDTTDDDNTGDSNFPATGVAGLAIFPVIIAGATVIAAKSKKK